MRTKPFSVGRWAGKQHYHGCGICGLRYPDACQTPEMDSRCPSCRMGRLSAYQHAVMPRPCCFADTHQAHKHERERLLLAGPGPWWVCSTCVRQFTIKPKETS